MIRALLILKLFAKTSNIIRYQKITKISKQQRPKKSELSGWQNSTRRNFPDEVREPFSRQEECVNRFRDKKVHKSAIDLQVKRVYAVFETSSLFYDDIIILALYTSCRLSA